MLNVSFERKRRIKKWPTKLNDVNDRFLPSAAKMVESEAKRRVPTDRGELKNSINSEVSGDEARVGTNVEYAAAVEYGTRPHFPPIKAIKEWAGRVIGDESLAFPIARKIARKGTKAQPYLRPALDERKKDLVKLYKQIFRRVFGG